MLSVSRRLLRHQQDAEDVFQATFLVLARKAGSISHQASVGSWLFGVAHRLALKARADIARRRNVPTEAAKPEPASTSKEAPRTDLHGDPLPDGVAARLGTVRFRHGCESLTGLAFLADNTSIVTPLHDGKSLGVWEATSGRLVRQIEIGSPVTSLVVTPNGEQLAVVAKEIRLLEPSSGKLSATSVSGNVGEEAIGFSAKSKRMAFTADDKQLASLTETGLLVIEDVASGKEIDRKEFLVREMTGLAMSADGGTLAVLGPYSDSRLFVWKRKAGDQPVEWPVGKGGRGCLAMSPNGQWLAVSLGHETNVAIWDVTAGRVKHKLALPDEGHIRNDGLAFTPDGKVLVTSTIYNRRTDLAAVHLWDAATGQLLGRLELSPTGCSWLAVSPDSRLLATMVDRGIRVWDLGTQKELSDTGPGHRLAPSCVSVSCRGVTATAGDDHVIHLWQTSTGKHLRTLMHGHWVRAIAFSHDGNRLALSSLDDTVCLWDVDTGREIYRLASHGRMGGYRALAFTPDGRQLRSWGDDDCLRVWDVATGKAIHEHLLRPGGMFVPDVDSPLRTRNWEIGNNEQTFSPDGSRLTLALGGKLHVFDGFTGQELKVLSTDRRYFGTAAMSPDGKQLLFSGPFKGKPDGKQETSVEVWDVESGKRVRELFGGVAPSGPVAFSGQGRRMAAYSYLDKTIKVWDAVSGDEVKSLSGWEGSVRRLALSPDGRKLVATLDDTTGLVWELPPKP